MFSDLQDKFGVVDDGVVYAVYDYDATNADELTFKTGDKLFVINKGDANESNWWWARLDEKHGYIPCNYLAV